MTRHSVRGADQVLDWRVSRSGRIATDQKAVRRRGPGRVVLGSKPQLATTKQLVRWAASKPQLATTEKLVSWVELVNWVGSKPQLATTETSSSSSSGDGYGDTVISGRA